MAFFNPNRNNKKSSSIATRIIRETIRKGGKIDEDVFRKIVRAKLDEKMSASSGYGNNAFTGMIGNNNGSGKRTRSKNAQKAIDMMNEIAKEKAARKQRKEVVIVARGFVNGKIDAKGRITDVSGNLVAQVNKKNGAMTTVNGQYFGVYKSKSAIVDSAIVDIINKNSPFLINQRRNILMQKAMEEQALRENNVSTASSMFLDVWGSPSHSHTLTDVWGNRATNIWGNPM